MRDQNVVSGPSSCSTWVIGLYTNSVPDEFPPHRMPSSVTLDPPWMAAGERRCVVADPDVATYRIRLRSRIPIPRTPALEAMTPTRAEVGNE